MAIHSVPDSLIVTWARQIRRAAVVSLSLLVAPGVSEYLGNPEQEVGPPGPLRVPGAAPEETCGEDGAADRLILSPTRGLLGTSGGYRNRVSLGVVI
jgi:hypothetical protein